MGFVHSHNIKHALSSPYHPQAQGSVERSNRTIGERVRIFSDGKTAKRWDELQAENTFAINTTIHKTTEYAPFYLMKGYQPRKPSDNEFRMPLIGGEVTHDRDRAREKQIISQQLTLNQTQSQSVDPQLSVGDFV